MNQRGMGARVAVLAVGEVALDDLLEAGLEQEALRDAVERRGEARDRRGGQQPAGAQRAPRLGQGAGAVAGLGQVVERPEHEHHVDAGVGERQLAGVAHHRGGEWRGPRGRSGARLLDVQRDGVEQVHLVALAGQRQRVGAGRPADVEDGGRRRGQEARQQLERAQELEAPPVAEAPFLVAAVVVGGDLVLVGHGRQPRCCARLIRERGAAGVERRSCPVLMGENRRSARTTRARAPNVGLAPS